ncbi:MAG: hypothetical protein ACK4MU_09325, partial [Thermomonas sp.]
MNHFYPADPFSWSGDCIQRATKLYRTLGRLVAKSLQDGRLVSLPLGRAIYERIQQTLRTTVYGDNVDIGSDSASASASASALEYLAYTDNELWRSLISLATSSSSAATSEKEDMVSGLCMTFTLPGDDHRELCPQGSSKLVTSDNLHEFIQLIAEY